MPAGRLIAWLILFMLPGVHVMASEVTVAYNNIPGVTSFVADWGLSFLIRDGEGVILFDTGGNPAVLIKNLQLLGVDASEIDLVVLSHYHRDHCGGLEAILRPGLTVFLPPSFSARFKDSLKARGARVIEVEDPRRIRDGVWSTGEISGAIPEQSLILRTSRGLVILTGCSHPGVAKICRRAREILREDIYLVAGGFHLSGASRGEIQEVIEELKAMGVRKIAPNHCTGSNATRMFEKAWGRNFIHLGVGESVSF